MLKKFVYIISFCLLLSGIQEKAVSYDTFDGRYHYNQNNEMPSGGYYSDFSQSGNEEILLIVDFSSSMNKQLGTTARYIQAIDAIDKVLRAIPRETKIGLRVFGISSNVTLRVDSNGNGRFNTHQICTSSKLAIPIASNNNSNISNKLSEYRPTGATPIGYSLRQAVQNDFNISNSMKHIILVTDGGENCGDDPCQYIKRLMATRNDITIDVIGITVDQNAYSQLYCIANSANGKYYNTQSVDDLNNTFKKVFAPVAKGVYGTSTAPDTQNPYNSSYSQQPSNYSIYGTSPYTSSNYNTQPTTQPAGINSNYGQVTPLYQHQQPQKKKTMVKYSNYSFEFDM